jgi:hypothetical protein
VQVAKGIHRVVGGTHKHWAADRGGPPTTAPALHVYPSSRGRILRWVGDAIEGASRGLRDLLPRG